jgi:MFS transporter, DHA1 family, multidrug resistance protein
VSVATPRPRAPLVLLAALTATGPFTLNIYLPVMPYAQHALGASVSATSLTLSAALIAFAVGILFCGPLSDRVGRRPVILAGLVVFAAGSALALIAPSVGWLIAARVIQALGSATGITIARAIVGDLYPRAALARTIAQLTMVMASANAVAPLVGGVIVELLQWRAVFALLLVAAAGLWLWALRALPETRSGAGHAAGTADLIRAAASVARRPVFLDCVLHSAVLYSSFFVFVSLMPYVLRDGLHRGATEYGTWYLLIAGGYFLGNYLTVRLGVRTHPARLRNAGISLQAGAALVAFLLARAGAWHPAFIFIPWAFIATGQGLTLPGLVADAVALAPEWAGTASGLLGFSQQLSGAVAVQLMSAAPTDTPLPVAGFVLAVTAIGWLALFVTPRRSSVAAAG